MKIGSPTRVVATMSTVVMLASVALISAAEAATPRCFGKRATIVGTRRADDIRGTRRADVIVAKGGNDIIAGRGGGDLICAGKGSDEITGNAGNDRIKAGGGSDLVAGGGGKDLIRAGGGSDLVAGQGGNDRIFGQGGSDALFGQAGGDLLVVGGGFFQFTAPGAGDDEVRGNMNPDFVSYFDSPNAVTVDLGTGTATGAGTDRLLNIDGAEGSLQNDTLLGSSGTNFLFGLDGNDTLEARGNAGDLLSPETVVDLRFDILGGDAGDDTITGGTGFNVIVHDLAPGAVNVDLQTGLATGDGTDTLSGIQAVIGTRFADTMRGDNGDNAFEPGAGADTIDGRTGTDTLVLLDAVSGNVDLGTGSATTIYRPFDPVTGQQGSPVTSTLALAGLENIWGSEGNDVLRGDDSANRIFGFLGSDQLFGLAGDDFLDGGPEFGTSAANAIDGGDGTDTCINGNATNCETAQAASSRAAFERSTWSALRATVRLTRRR